MAEPKDFPTIADAARFVVEDVWEVIDDHDEAVRFGESVKRWSAEAVRKAQESAYERGWEARHHYDERAGEAPPLNPYEETP